MNSDTLFPIKTLFYLTVKEDNHLAHPTLYINPFRQTWSKTVIATFITLTVLQFPLIDRVKIDFSR